MNLITAIPIYRNRFQKPALFFSKHSFETGSVAFVPFPKNEKPAFILNIDDLQNQKTALRKSGVKIKISKIDNPFQIKVLNSETLRVINLAEEKTNHSFEDIFQKVFTPKLIKELNNLKQTSNFENIIKYSEKIDLPFVKDKLKKRQKKVTVVKGELSSIGSLLQQKEITKKTSIHSEKHYLIGEIRNYFFEDAKKGLGSFSFYLGFFKKIPENEIYRIWSEVKQSRKSLPDQKKLFWWKVGQYIKVNKN